MHGGQDAAKRSIYAQIKGFDVREDTLITDHSAGVRFDRLVKDDFFRLSDGTGKVTVHQFDMHTSSTNPVVGTEPRAGASTSRSRRSASATTPTSTLRGEGRQGRDLAARRAGRAQRLPSGTRRRISSCGPPRPAWQPWRAPGPTLATSSMSCSPAARASKELAAVLHAMESAIAITEPKSVVDYAIKVVVGLGDGVLSEMQATMLIERPSARWWPRASRLPGSSEARAVGRGALPSAKVGGSPDA